MEQTSVQKLARVLRVLVLITFVCNLIVLLLVPALAGLMAENRWDGQALQRILEGGPYQNFFLQFILYGWHPVIWMLALTSGDFYWPVLTLFLWACGTCTAVILWQGKRVLDTILKGNGRRCAAL